MDDIVAGTSMPRNMFLFTNSIYLLLYTGAGSGMLRALSENVKVSFTNNDRTAEFVITINRPESNQFNADSDTNSDTKLRNSDTGLDSNSDTRRPKIINKQRDIVNFCSVHVAAKKSLRGQV